MENSRALRSAVVVILLLAAFMAGRASVSPTETDAPAATARTTRPHKLSAIIPAGTDRGRSPQLKPTSTGSQPADPLLVDQIDRDLKVVADFLAAAASEPGDLRILSGTIAAWMDHDADGAIDWLATGDRRDEILRLMFEAWGKQNPGAALAWLAAKRDTDRYEHAAFGLAGYLDSEGALQLADTLNAPSRRAAIWTSAGVDLYANDPEAALERLATAGFPDELERLTIRAWKQALSNQSKRDAQNLASVFSSAVAAGARFQGTSSEEIVHELVAGVTGSGAFDTTRFRVPGMSEQAIAYAIENLTVVGGDQLNYDPAPAEEF